MAYDWDILGYITIGFPVFQQKKKTPNNLNLTLRITQLAVGSMLEGWYGNPTRANGS